MNNNKLEDWVGKKVRVEWADNNADKCSYTFVAIDSVLGLVLLDNGKGMSWANIEAILSIRLSTKE